jgi:hypothetical protein
MSDKPLVHYRQTFRKSDSKIILRHMRWDLLNASQFSFCAPHRTTLQYVRLTDHVTFIFNNKICTALYSWISKSLWYMTSQLVIQVYKLKILTNLIKLISSFLSERKFTVRVKDKMSTPREIHTGVPQRSVLSGNIVQYVYKGYPSNTRCTLTLVCMPWIENKVKFSESCSGVSIQLRGGMSAGI